ncbi:MAG: KilA-N domain-containing protein [Bacteroidota bacterium]
MGKRKSKNKRIVIEDAIISWQEINDQEYISLTDMSNWDNDPNSRSRIQSWLKNGNTVRFLSIWEKFNNPDFNYMQMNVIKNQIADNAYVLTVKRWIEETNAKGIFAKAGRYGGTYAHRDIAFEFATWLSPEFKFYLIKEFQRLKEEESEQKTLRWDYQRFLSKVNYKLHTATIRDHILPSLQTPKNQEWIIYADEADLLNVAVFGMTAKEWRENNPSQAQKGNMRDFADIIQLNVLANLESLNAVLIEQGASKEARFELLSRTSISQYQKLAEQEELNMLDS